MLLYNLRDLRSHKVTGRMVGADIRFVWASTCFHTAYAVAKLRWYSVATPLRRGIAISFQAYCSLMRMNDWAVDILVYYHIRSKRSAALDFT